MLAKNSISKVVFLCIITFGIYGIFWLAWRRNEIVKYYNIPLPHWGWLAIPALILLPGSLIVAVTASLSLPENVALASALCFVALAATTLLGISLWWMSKFGAAVEKITNGRMPASWVMLYWYFTGFCMVAALQYFFNQLPAKNKLRKSTQQPSKRFVAVSIGIFIMVGIASMAVAVGVILYTTPGQDSSTTREIERLNKEATLLSKKYDYCIAQLDKEYPEVSPDQEADYMREYDACEAIRLQQNAKVDEVTKLQSSFWAL